MALFVRSLVSAALVASALTPTVHAQDADDGRFRVDWQVTNVTQRHDRFHSPYSGPNSLKADESTKETTDATLFLGWRIQPTTELWVNPEVDQGFGLSDTLGVAGFPSGEAYKVGSNSPYLRLQRVFLRHTVSLGGETQRLDAAPNRFATEVSADNLVFTIGRYSAVDLFDTNRYAHDPRGDFLNWSVIDAGTFDYAADPWGYTWGAAAEWTTGAWTSRFGIFQLSELPNEKIVRPSLRQSMSAIELEHRHAVGGQAGAVRLLVFNNRANMATYRDAVLAAGAGSAPDLATVRRKSSKPGVSLNVEQELPHGWGAFLRAGANEGAKEAFEFTEIARTVSVGTTLSGASWSRADDRTGLALVENRIPSDTQSYFKAGGLGILIGDGNLTYGPERIAEWYYAARLGRHVTVSLDLQRIVHPAYNRDRGPVSVVGLRLHLES
jgi:high affinity Mn2+ porin